MRDQVVVLTSNTTQTNLLISSVLGANCRIYGIHIETNTGDEVAKIIDASGGDTIIEVGANRNDNLDLTYPLQADGLYLTISGTTPRFSLICRKQNAT